MMSRRAYTMQSTVADLTAAMKKAGVARGYVHHDEKSDRPKASHPIFQPIADFMLKDKVDYKRHEAFFFQLSPSSGCLMGAALWNTTRGQGCGGVRFRTYDSVEGMVRDGLRLSIGMGRKSALAGLWWGGGKGLIVKPEGGAWNDSKREALMRDYGAFLTSLRGCYVSAEDVGTFESDMNVIYSRSRFITCVSPKLGGSGNPSVPTALGVVRGMEGALDHMGMGSLKGKSVAIQGLGNVGEALVGFLLDHGVARIVGSDISADTVARVQAKYGNRAGVSLSFRAESGDDVNTVLYEDVDIVSPCGFGGVINAHTVPRIKAKIVAGAANNQLLNPADDYGMQARGITYVPDFVLNRLGIVNCADEQFGRVGDLGDYMRDPAIARHLGREWENSVFVITKAVLAAAAKDGVSPNASAEKLADHFCTQPHPIWGRRTRAIIDSLVRDGWETVNVKSG